MMVHTSNILLIVAIYHIKIYLEASAALQRTRPRIREIEVSDDVEDRKQSPARHSHSQNQYNQNHQPNSRTTRAVYMAVDNSNLSRSNRTSQLQSSYPPFAYQNDQQSLGSTILDQCCACDEAKYELVFEGLWSRYTHPDDFPENYWLAKFSDIIGASHSNEFRMWKQDTYATEGVRELAETGSTKKLESELKQVSSKTRTIIKARELHYPTLNSKTSAVFRTDRQHHLVSVLSKLSPSPDWMVGVSGLELCQSDCSWASQRVINLHLWDAGTDSGTTFTSPDSPTRPQEKIHPLRKIDSSQTTTKGPETSNNGLPDESGYQRRSFLNTNDQSYSKGLLSDSPSIQDSSYVSSYSSPQTPTSSSAEQTKPFARLTITRQRIYEKSCTADSSPSNLMPVPAIRHPTTQHQTQYVTSSTSLDSWLTEPARPSYDCRYTEWSDWSTCSSTCGRGIRTRTRALIDEQVNLGSCSQVDLIEKEVCLSECIGNTTCITRDWSEWSKCSVHCGQGQRKRTRSPIGPLKRVCESLELVETELCIGEQGANCTSDPSACELSEWSQWSDCSVACGRGTRIRTRQYLKKEGLESCSARLIQKQSCNGRPELCKQIPKASSSILQQQQQQQKSNLNLPVIDCKLSAWSPWSTCSALCGFGKRTRSRYIIQMPQNGGKPCDKKLSRTQRCKDLPSCPPDYVQQGTTSQLRQPTIQHPSRLGSKHIVGGSMRNHAWHSSIATTTTTQSSSMMDDDDDSKFSRLMQSESSLVQPSSFSSISIFDGVSSSSSEMELIADDENHPPIDEPLPCQYGNWSEWSDCEVVCQPVKKGSNKVRKKLSSNEQNGRCKAIEEFYYCDPNVYC